MQHLPAHRKGTGPSRTGALSRQQRPRQRGSASPGSTCSSSSPASTHGCARCFCNIAMPGTHCLACLLALHGLCITRPWPADCFARLAAICPLWPVEYTG